MSDPTIHVEGALQGKVSGRRTRAGLLAVTLGLSATLVASPTVKQEMSADSGSPIHGKKEAVKHHWFQIGTASWYGGKFNGRPTATGETYDMYALTCAHRTLPLGSWVRVTNLRNKKSVLLRVNDRGPVPERIIADLSFGAAQRLGVQGLAKVRLEAISPSDPRVAEQMVALLKMDDPALLPGISTPQPGILAGAMPVVEDH
jgi:rare lipoprotein A